MGFGSVGRDCALAIRTHADMVEMEDTYPEVELDVATAAKFAVSNLKGNRHSVIGMKEFVKTFAGMSAKLDVVSIGDAC